MKAIRLESTLPPLPAMKSSIYRIENKIKQLKRNHHGDDIVLIKNEPFIAEQVERQYRADGEEETYPLPVTIMGTSCLKLKHTTRSLIQRF